MPGLAWRDGYGDDSWLLKVLCAVQSDPKWLFTEVADAILFLASDRQPSSLPRTASGSSRLVVEVPDRAGIQHQPRPVAMTWPGIVTSGEQKRQPRMRLEPHRLVFIDESATTTKMARLRGRARPGQRLKACAPSAQWKVSFFNAVASHLFPQTLSRDAQSVRRLRDRPVA